METKEYMTPGSEVLQVFQVLLSPFSLDCDFIQHHIRRYINFLNNIIESSSNTESFFFYFTHYYSYLQLPETFASKDRQMPVLASST